AMDRLPQVAVIRNSGADIIALQEVSDDAVEVLHDHLRDRYPYRVLYPKGVAGTGLLSRYPLLEAEVTELTPGTYNTRAVVDVGGVPITVISAHPPAPITSFNRRYTRRGRREIQRLLGLVRDAPGPVLLMGDFNHADQSRDYRLMPAAGLQDAFREAGWGLGPTWPCRIRYLGRSLPLVRIDYIWTTPHFHIRRCWVGPPGNSDHAPVIADVVVIPGSLRTG
ncbi:MAG TPA: endonuclease/exonuclease/phosphatase family protein, partial [bacterium]|nr:endonuclease/exonuclease/phosphatase family protein [bacterium]